MSKDLILNRLTRYTDIMITPFVTEPNYARLKEQFQALNEDMAETLAYGLVGASKERAAEAALGAIESRLEPVAQYYQNGAETFDKVIQALEGWSEQRTPDYAGTECANVYRLPELKFLSHSTLNMERLVITVATNLVFENGELEGALEDHLLKRFNTLQDVVHMVEAVDIGKGAVVVDIVDPRNTDFRAISMTGDEFYRDLVISEANRRASQGIN